MMARIQRYDKDKKNKKNKKKKKKKRFIFDTVQKRETNWNFTGCQSPRCINTIYQFIRPFLDKKKMSIYEEYGAFNNQCGKGTKQFY